MKKNLFRVLACVFLFALAACNSVEIGNSKDVNPESIYFDYKIWGTEGKSDINCMFQYRFAGPNGTTLLLNDPAKVSMDGKILVADSAKFTGVYYESNRPIDSFTGRHTILFTGSDKKQFREEFDFMPFSLKTELPETIPRKAFAIQLKNLSLQPVQLRLVMTDTAFASNDFNEKVVAVNGIVHVNVDMLSQLKKGPVSLELYKEDELPLKEHTKEGGKITISYGLKRDFLLVE